jgi:protein O-GlcNAc transferase
MAMNPNVARIFDEAVALHRAGRLSEAEQRYKTLLAGEPAHADAAGLLGTLYAQQDRYDEAAQLMGLSLRINPQQPAVLNNRGILLSLLKRYDEALISVEAAIALRGDFAEAHYNRGNALQELGRYDEAVASFDRAVALQPNYTDAWVNRGNALHALRRFDEALASYDRALTLDPQNPYAQGARLHAQMLLADWRDFDARLGAVMTMVQTGGKASVPFAMLAVPGSPQILKRCAQIYGEDRYPPSPNPLWKGEHYRHDRLRIGYFSADFHAHPVSYLAAELFERHDRTRFEVIGFSLGPETGDALRARLRQGFDRFLDVAAQSDQAVAALVRELEIDIAIDLQGFTQGNRTGIFARRVAPVQASYLGFAGTMGAAYIDYLITDPIVIPSEEFGAYAEKIVHLPHCYLPSDSQRSIASHLPSRTEAGLPDRGFVFCCFNNSFKITPDLFAIWMRLLGQVEGSVLWLREDNATARVNLQREARQRGIAPDRLIFAGRVPEMADHLARYRLADLFLDTLYFNAHATASDALWAGLPVLTCRGNTFAGRVAASLLTSLGLSALITTRPEAYEAEALRLARDPALLASLKEKLAANKRTYPAFDIASLTRHLDAAYRTMWQRFRDGAAPDHIRIAP